MCASFCNSNRIGIAHVCNMSSMCGISVQESHAQLGRCLYPDLAASPAFRPLTISAHSFNRDMSVAFVRVKILKYRDVSDVQGVRYTAYVPRPGTFADVRTVLTEDMIMKPEDMFYIDGIRHGRSSERHASWTTVIPEVCRSESCVSSH